ncbi:MAG: hypothetical protein PHX78_04065 [bacterium]|nr:hypothetical protein [bacterium]
MIDNNILFLKKTLYCPNIFRITQCLFLYISFKKNYKKILFFVFLLLINSLFTVYAERYGYIANSAKKIYEVDFDSMKILRETDAFGFFGDIVYDSVRKKGYGLENFSCNVLDVNSFTIIKKIDRPVSYSYTGTLALNISKNQIYVGIGSDENSDRKTIIYSGENYSQIGEIDDSNFIVYMYQFSSDGEYMYIAGTERNTEKYLIQKRNTNNFGLISSFYLPEETKTVCDLDLSHDNSKLYISAIYHGEIREILLNSNNGNILANFIVKQGSAALTNDDNYLYIINGEANDNVILYKINTSTFEKEEISLGNYSNIWGDMGTVISQDDSILLTGYGTGYKYAGYVTVIDLKTKVIKGQIGISADPVGIFFK